MISDRFLDGIWHDTEYDAFITIDWDDDNELVLICDEDGKILDTIEEVDFNPGMFYRIHDDIIDNPAGFLEDRLDRLQDGYYAKNTSFREVISIQYAVEHVTIVSNDE